MSTVNLLIEQIKRTAKAKGREAEARYVKQGLEEILKKKLV